ncbi:hypothetical protein ERO13_D08G032550v2 [Gossypium hirsutum]|uniref:CLAVATA3/ESR-like protein n=4 Tax=Gossypium TaxID=3633 RepID=A0A5J5QB50_GOSBA|nr:hypothetical protein ES319_D08G029600v1 [Gossypium barbadense]KAG4132436.1 hypothetical protein ERO13_D08G032550v2 [Gossypium hirsutum]TYG56037.1 hypothetical protein ES288_D08G031100v1 [Gossypium darwinii]TYH56595.1 hypothetical protein ES332_D08G030700v1 [Gossypium tomentosum]TYI67611.1 hypothetical protein E1A91_D08G030300v1 [Gossypium mustelinum]
MATFNLFFILSFYALLLISCSATRLLLPFSVSNEFSSFRGRYLPQPAVITSVTSTIKPVEKQQVRETNGESQQYGSTIKRALIMEGREAIKASLKRNAGNPLESKRRSPGGPDPHHH